MKVTDLMIGDWVGFKIGEELVIDRISSILGDSVIGESLTRVKVKYLGAIATIFVICYYAGLVGMGILLSCPVLWYALGWSVAAHALEIGLGFVLVPAIIILIAGFYSSKE